MGKKKLRDPEPAPEANDAVSSQSQPDIFNALFGYVNDAASIFSDQNPFKRKPLPDLSQTLTLTLTPEPAPTGPGNGGSGGEAKRPKREKLRDAEPEDAAGLNKKQRKRDEVEREYEARKYGSVNGGGEEGEERVSERVGAKRKTADNPAEDLVPKEGFDDEGKLLRTVFVGNLPLNVKKKAMIKEFSRFGEVDSVRIRSVPIADVSIENSSFGGSLLVFIWLKFGTLSHFGGL